MEIFDIIPANYQLTQNDKQKFLELILVQLSKDLSPHVTCKDFIGVPTTEKLLEIAELAIEVLWVHKFPNVAEVMYRIDIPEPIIKQWLRTESNREKISELTVTILRREAMKVWFRQFYQD
ncbi:MAG: hypothetical protein SGI87_07025 [Flavobacteriales bacterium]|nr:hypothetical protein [Flavobacteriales bacterium]